MSSRLEFGRTIIGEGSVKSLVIDCHSGNEKDDVQTQNRPQSQIVIVPHPVTRIHATVATCDATRSLFDPISRSSLSRGWGFEVEKASRESVLSYHNLGGKSQGSVSRREYGRSFRLKVMNQQRNGFFVENVHRW